MKGFKAFKKGLVCRGYQFEEGKTFEQEGRLEVCGNGFHFCENPFDVLEYYPLVADDGSITEFAEVEAIGEVKTEENKSVTNKIRIGAKIGLPGFIKASIDFLWERVKPNGDENTEMTTDERNAQIGSSGHRAKIGSSGHRAQIGSSGDGAQIGSSGHRAQIGSSGDWAQIGSSGDWAQIGSSGHRAKIGSSGDGAKIGSSGDGAQIGSSGHRAQIGSSGHRAQIGSSGHRAQIGSSGDWAQIGSSGHRAQIGSSGHRAQIGSSGDGAKIGMEGNHSVAASVGHAGRIRGKLGCWITLAEWKQNDEGSWIPVCVKSAQIDGQALKEDTWYELKGGEFSEVSDEE